MKFLLKTLTIFILWSIVGLEMTFAQVSFSAPGGFYQHSFSLTLTCNNGTIHYTLDGSVPNAQSATYTSPLTLSPDLYSTRHLFLQQNAPDEWWNPPTKVNHVIVIRAAAFDANGNQIGADVTNTYFISDLTGYTPRLPMLSVTIEPNDLFAVDSGIFSPNGWEADNDFTTGNFNQHGREWERLANIEFYELNGSGFSQKLGLRVHGGKTRRIMQKPLKFYARKEYGKKYISYPVFDTRPYSSYKRLVIKPFSASWEESGLADYLAQNIADPLRFVSLASRPITVYINGEYWGIYFLQEAPDEHLIAQIDNVDDDDVNLIGAWWGTEENGSNIGFNQMMAFLNSADLSDSIQYQYLCSLIDIDDFIDYQLFEAFIANRDWPSNNMRCYQHDVSLWRWIFYDGDAAFQGFKYDMTEPMTYTGDEGWPSSIESTLCFRKLVQSPIFLSRFYARMKELNSTVFNYANTAPLLYKATAEVLFEVDRQSERFNKPYNHSKWEKAITDMDKFLQKRVSFFETQMTELLSVPSDANLSFVLYPNPAHNTVNIFCNSDITGLAPYGIYDNMGKMVLQGMITVSEQNLNSIDISSLSNGVYIVYFPSLKKAIHFVVR